ncbi:ankyrin repeats (3 copies) domain-containing protein [Ditylenchus destructor]|nr:ankyrin repeats (3 copies) domain-containing protein [Ditylenchus destructor]
MDHSALIAELPSIEQMTPQQRIALARQRREQQLISNQNQERILPPPPNRRPRLRFSAEVALLEATGRGDVAEVERLLMEGANPDSHNEDGLTPLHQCAIDNNEPIVRLLLRHNADVNAKDTELWTPLHAAACCGYIDIVRLLINHTADLLAVNADGNMPYDICDDEHTLDLIESEMANRGITQQFIDEHRGQPEKEMLDDMKLLHQKGHALDVRMPDGSTYLHVAAANGFYDVAAFLLRCGVHPSVRDNDFWTPVHASAMWNQPDLIELLCEYGADINSKSNSGETPLDLCEDNQTRQVIATVQHNEARKKRLAFGVRDSRRQSRKRKKFESPQQAQLPNADNPFSARGTIRRQSLRDRTGMTLGRLDAQKEQSDLMRSWSKEDVNALNQDDVSQLPSGSVPGATKSRESPKRNLGGGKQQKTKPMSPDEWLRKLEDPKDGEEDEDEQLDRNGGGLSSNRQNSKRGKRGKKNRTGEDTQQTDTTQGTLNGAAFGGFKPTSSGSASSPNRRKDKCGCCALM